jgi:hypothetical protein
MSDWKRIDVRTLTPAQNKAYVELKEKQRAFLSSKQAFESLMQAGVPAGHVLHFSYKWGTLSALLTQGERKIPTKPVNTVSLSEYIAECSPAEGIPGFLQR